MIDKALLDECRALVSRRSDEVVALCRSMVKVPSLPGEEGPVADLALAAMQALDYDETWVDPAGNVVGIVQGSAGPRTMFNGHMDIVDAGNPEDWAHPPFAGEIHDGYLWGRGSADMKGPLAAMIFAAGLFKAWGRVPRGDVVVCAVSLEEVGGWGSQLLLEHNDLGADRAVVGEPTDSHLLRGHRGRIILQAHIKGKSMHGSIVDRDANPLFPLARFINALPEASATLAKRVSYLTVTPTAIVSSPAGPNLTPSDLTQTLDARVGPGVEAGVIRRELNGLLQKHLGPACLGGVEIARQGLRTYTGLESTVEDVVPGYELLPGDAWAREAGEHLRMALGYDPWGELARFTCDACRLGQAGIPTLLFGPGDIGLAHSADERIPIQQLLEGVVAYMALVL
jgi:putative selenium metabolism hydrolase